jgi:hypothetical protein
VVSGIINEKEVIEIFSNDQGEWASYVTSTDGNMCTVDIGIHFRQYGDDQKIAGVKNSASNGAPMIRYRELGLSSIFRQQSF